MFESQQQHSLTYQRVKAFSLLGGLIDECIFDVLLGVHKDLRTRTSVCQICQSTCQGYGLWTFERKGTCIRYTNATFLLEYIVNETGCDIFGNSYTSNNLPSYECVNCHKMYPATRYAPHLEKCLGLAGRQSTRVANRRMGSQSPFTALNLSEDSMGGAVIIIHNYSLFLKISNDLSRLKKIRAQDADHIRAELEDSDTSESNYRSNGRRSASPGSYAGDVKRSSSVPIKDVPKSPTSDDSLSKSDRRATAKAGRSKSKLAIYSSDEEEFDSKADFIGKRWYMQSSYQNLRTHC
ncbi:hypothetical protein NQZ79_g8056 [Umbelopsis isabellina]|nr:hypothetical protein NQZ79_g8056 [Umbelopsis isabellina]